MTRLKRQASQELLPTRAPKLARGQGSSVLSRLGEGLNTCVNYVSSNVSAFCEAAIEDVIPKPSHRPKPSHPPPRTPRKIARPAIPKEFRVELQPSVGPSPPSSSTPSPTRKPETTRSSFPALPPPSQTRALAAFPSTIGKQGSQESATSVETLLVSARRRRKNGIKNHRTNGLPAYYQSRDHIHAKRHKAEVQKSRKDDRQEMLKALYEDKRSKGYSSSYKDFESFLRYKQYLERGNTIRDGLSSRASMSDLDSKTGAAAREQRRHSLTEFTKTELADDFVKRLFQRAKKSLHGPPPKRPFVPSFEQLQLSRKAKDEEIERFLRPKKAPLPLHLPPEDEAYVDAILTKRGIISKTGREQVADKDVARLRPYQWLNDEIINFYGQLILSRSGSQKENSSSTPADVHINGLVNGIKGKGKAKAVEKKPLLGVHYFSTFFWPKLTGDGYDKGRLAKWTKKDVILIPINHNSSHWTAAAINFRRKRIESYDSMGMARSTVHKVLREYLDDEHRNKKKKPFDFTGWVDWVDETTPQQENGYDCGVFTCQFLQALSRGEEDGFGFSQVDMPYLRRRMIWEIGNAKLRDDP
ncbi:cysteine proteinase [Thelephora ganbajun]|uniref:Cysteine proteinase n=1 Tax=Thelephora ganbajun TaxID=370292 RepID=A0ACB6ZD88_THEGA|nr:cysteine proteinase [Thelephora ganbajun]